MSASHSQLPRIFKPIAQSNANVATQSLLNFDQIFELLNKGLMDFIACFTEDEERTTAFKIEFSASLMKQPLDKQNFNQFGTLMIKAGYPGILKLATGEEDKLKKLGILSRSQNPTLSIGHFFKRSDIEKFVNVEVKEKYRADIFSLVEAIYGFVETATCSIEYEHVLTKFDKNNMVILDKNIQPAIFSGIDLQLASSTNSLKLISKKLVQLKGQKKIKLIKAKTSKADAITQSLEKMRAAITTATSERTNNLAEQKSETLKKESNATKSELDNAKVTLQSMQAQLDEERSKAQELAAQKAELEKLALDGIHPGIIAVLKVKTADFSPQSPIVQPILALSNDSDRSADVRLQSSLSVRSSSSHVHKTSDSSDLSVSSRDTFFASSGVLSARYKSEVLRKAVELEREQEHIKLSTEIIIEEARMAAVNRTSLSKAFDNLMLLLNSSTSTQASIFIGLILWEKSALSYIENNKSTASISTAVAQRLPVSMVSALSFIGQKTGIGKMKTVDPVLASALKLQLTDILKQCILITENDKNFHDCVRGLNQHHRYLTMNNTEAVLAQGTVSAQFASVTAAITAVATNRFKFVPAPTLVSSVSKP